MHKNKFDKGYVLLYIGNVILRINVQIPLLKIRNKSPIQIKVKTPNFIATNNNHILVVIIESNYIETEELLLTFNTDKLIIQP